MARDIFWSRAALDDFKSQLAFIARENASAARNVADRIHRAAEGLSARPTGRPGRVPGTFEKSVPALPYILCYRIRSEDAVEQIVILRVIHMSRNWPPGGWPGA